MHRSCAARYFLRLSNSTANTTNRKNAYPCPGCKQEWNKDDVNSILKGNKVNEENGNRTSNGMGNKKQRTSGTNDRSTRSSNRRIVDESDED
jgi:hypothetical protein